MSHAVAEALIVEVGTLLELTEVARIDESQGSWTVVVEDDVLVLLTHASDPDRLTLAAEAATPPADLRAALYQTVLLYNNQWAATGGVRMALAEPDGAIVQLFDVPLGGLDATGLANLLTGFVEKLRGWRGIIGGGDAPRQADHDDLGRPGMIRV